MGEGGQGGEEGCHLTRSLPEVGRAQVGGSGWAGEKVGNGVVGGAAFRAQWGGRSANSVEVIPHGRGEPRPQLCEGGPEAAGEVFLLSVDWRRRPTEDPIWASRLDGSGDGSPMDLRQCLPVGVLRGSSVLEEGLDRGEEFGPEGLADATGTRVGGDHRVGGVARAESSQQELLAEHG